MAWKQRLAGWFTRGVVTEVHAMGVDVGNVEVGCHAQPFGAVTADRYIRFHLGNDSIDEELFGSALGGIWKALADAVRTNSSSAFTSAVNDLKLLVTFTWSQDWTDALHAAFKDVIFPA